MATRGQRLNEALSLREIKKQLALAAALHVHESAITRWKNNHNMSIDNVVALCKELDISADWLLMGRGAIDQHKLVRDARRTTSLADLSKRSIDLLNQFFASLVEADGEQVPAAPKTTS